MLRKITYTFQYLFTSPPWDTGITPPELKACIQDLPPGRALDLGCGTGTNVIFLAQHGWQTTGVDFVEHAIQIARRKSLKAGVYATFLVGNVAHLGNFPDLFDLILDIGCFHSLASSDREAYINGVTQLLAPEGVYLLYLFFRDQDEKPGAGVTQTDLDALSQHLTLVKRQDGTERGRRSSAWLTYKKKEA